MKLSVHNRGVRAIVNWFMYHVGRRGSFLLFLAVLDFVYAWALKLEDTPQQVQKPDFILPWQAWAIWWLTTGVVVMVGAFLRKDVWAFSFAALLKGAWASVSLALWIQGRQPNGWLSAAVWMAFAGTVLVISSWPETLVLHTIEPEEIEVPHASE
jgi:hypothetical protein